MSNILITGGAGFIGSHLVESLISKKNSITIIDNLSTGRLENLKAFKQDIKFIKADISIKGEWQKKLNNQDYIFHLAALADIVPSIEKARPYYNSNVTGTLNVMEALKKSKKLKKFVYTASSSCYGIPKNYPTNEKELIDPKYPYALTKFLGEEIVHHWGKLYKIPTISLRLFNVYGTKSRTSGTYGAMFGVFLAQKLANKPLTVVGSGNQTRDFTYVTDVVRALNIASKSKFIHEIFNIGTGKSRSINEVVKILNQKAIFVPKRPGEPDCTMANIAKAKKLLNWKPQISLKKGIGLLIDDIDYWSNAPVWDKKNIKIATKLWFKYLNDK